MVLSFDPTVSVGIWVRLRFLFFCLVLLALVSTYIPPSLVFSQLVGAEKPDTTTGIQGDDALDDPVDDAERATLVAQAMRRLETGNYEQRQASMAALQRYPREALKALESLDDRFDAETSLLVSRIRAQLQQRVVEEDLASFVEPSAIQDTIIVTAKNADDWSNKLPLWAIFKEKLGDNDTSRRLYASALRHHWVDFNRIVKDAQDVGEVLEGLLQNESQESSLDRSTITTILVLATHEAYWGKEGMDEQLMAELENRLSNNSLAFRTSPFQEVNRSLLADWCTNRKMNLTQFSSYHSYLQLAIQCNVGEAFPKLLEITRNTKLATYARGTSLLYAIALAKSEDVPQLESLLADKTIIATPSVQNGKKQVECTICDYALLGLAVRSGMSMKEIGFEELQVTSLMNIDRNAIGFVNEVERQKAIDRWKKFRDANISNWPSVGTVSGK